MNESEKLQQLQDSFPELTREILVSAIEELRKPGVSYETVCDRLKTEGLPNENAASLAATIMKWAKDEKTKGLITGAAIGGAVVALIAALLGSNK